MTTTNKELLYFDNAATTPVLNIVLEAMLPYFTQFFGNASSATHQLGWQAKGAIEKARVQVAALFDVPSDWVYFTSGATESLVWVLQSFTRVYAPNGGHIISFTTEHAAILQTLKQLQKQGYRVSLIGVDQDGMPDWGFFEKAFKADTFLVAAMHANNETGVLWPLDQISDICKKHNAFFISDTTQTAAKINIPFRTLGLSAATISAHKINGPKGVGALIVSKRNPRITMQPLLLGGGQEMGLRAGTLNVPGIVGLGAAAEYWLNNRLLINQKILDANKYFNLIFSQKFPLGTIHGHKKCRINNIINCSMITQNAAHFLAKHPNIAVATSAACSSEFGSFSHVLLAMGASERQCNSALRFSFGATTTIEELKALEMQFFN